MTGLATNHPAGFLGMNGRSSGSLPIGNASSADDLNTEAFRRQMDEVASRIPPHAIRSVLEAVEDGASPVGKRARHLRDALVHHYNRLRPMKARRLFTSLFEPFLVDDHILYRAPDTVPALIQRADMGGIWAALTHYAFPALAVEVQGKLDAMARETMLDAVLASPQAVSLREAMRREALTFLIGLATDHAAAERFLALANDEALQDAQLRTQYLGRKAPIDGDLLGFVRALLEHHAALAPLTERMRRDFEAMPKDGDSCPAAVDCQAALMVGFVRQVRDLGLPFRDQTQALAWFAPLYGLNVKQRYDVFLQHAREHGCLGGLGGLGGLAGLAGPTMRESHPLMRSLLGHFHAASYTMRDVAEGLFADVDLRDGGVLSIRGATRDLLAEAVERFDRSLSALAATGLLAAPSTGPAIRAQLADLGRCLTATALPVLESRTRVALNARRTPSPDQADVLWMLELVERWAGYLAGAGVDAPDLTLQRRCAVENGRTAFLKATTVEGDERPAHRMAHLLRIRRLMRAMGETTDAWIGPASPGLDRVVQEYLDRIPDITAEEWGIIDLFIAALHAERTSSPDEPSADCGEILRLHEIRMR